jgi:ABC-2 type transport system permease protein
MIAFPVELLLGHLTPDEAITGFAAQITWLLLALAILKLTWQRASKRYAAVGA